MRRRDPPHQKVKPPIHPALVSQFSHRTIRLANSGTVLLYQRFDVFGRPESGGKVIDLDFLRWMTVPQAMELIMKRVRKIDPATQSPSGPASFTDPDFASEYPSIAEFLFTVEYEDGSPRKPSSVTIFQHDGMLKAVLKDPDNNRAMWASGESFMDLLSGLDGLLDSDNAVWRVDRQGPGDTANRKKK